MILRFHFDFVSPYSYLAWTQIHSVAERHGCAVEPIPVLFAGLLNHHGMKGPAEVPAKRRYLLFDVVRKARQLGVPFGLPAHHPFNPLLALRVVSVPMRPEQRRPLIDRIYAGVWSGEAVNVEDATTLSRFASEVGVDARVVDEAGSPEGKARLKDQTERAIADGVFGVPTTMVNGEPFWGVEALGALEHFLVASTPTLDAAMLDRWSKLTPSAQRKIPT